MTNDESFELNQCKGQLIKARARYNAAKIKLDEMTSAYKILHAMYERDVRELKSTLSWVRDGLDHITSDADQEQVEYLRGRIGDALGEK